MTSPDRRSSEPPIEATEILHPEASSVRLQPDQDLPSIARYAGEVAMSASLVVLRTGLGLGRSVFRRVAKLPPARVVTEAAAGALDAIVADIHVDLGSAGRRSEEQLGRIVSVVVPVLVQAVDLRRVMEYIDVNALLEEVDVNALLERVDLDALLEEVDVAELAKRARIGDLVAEGTTDVAETALDVGRRQAVAVDTLIARGINRILGRGSTTMPPGPSVLTDGATES